MRLITYNLWHGLSPSTPVAFEALEPVARRELRENLQINVLRELKPDICFFQEMNPAPERAPLVADALGMEFAIQPDLVGLKLFGVGLPLNLNSGLVIMTAKEWGLRKVAGVSLDRPGTNLVHSWGSWQLKEERFALFCETMLPGWGRVLMVDTHLHHGLESTPELVSNLEKLSGELNFSDNVIVELKDRLAQGNLRRTLEIANLLHKLETVQDRYEVVILAGDFNASPESELGQTLKGLGFRDSWFEAKGDEPGHSFDREANKANHILQDRFPLSLVVEDLTFSSKGKEALLAMARKQETRPRRIDYIWVRSRTVKIDVKDARLVGLPNSEGLAPSDHFGVCVDLEVQ